MEFVDLNGLEELGVDLLVFWTQPQTCCVHAKIDRSSLLSHIIQY